MFWEQFEAKKYLLSLFGKLNESESAESRRAKAKSGSSRGKIQEANQKASNIFADRV